MEYELHIEDQGEILQLAFDDNPIGTSVTRFDLTYVRVNKALCEMFGYAPEYLIGRNMLEFVHPDHVDISKGLAEQLFEGHIRSYVHERLFIRRDQTPIWTEVTATILRDQQGRPRYRMAMIRDIAERKQLELERAQRARLEGVLLAAATMQHELNNKLAIVMGNTELIVHRANLTSNMLTLARDARQFAVEAAEMVNQLVNISHIEEKDWGENLGPTIDISRSLTIPSVPDQEDSDWAWDDIR